MNIPLSDKVFSKIRKYIDEELGIKMPDIKRIMVESRLQKRLRELDFDNFEDYCEYLFSKRGLKEERPNFFNSITTNKTDFFREKEHFEYLKKDLLPELLQRKQGAEIKIWSCACSSGQEPYTIGIVIEEYKLNNPGFDYKIVATDISTKVLVQAKNAVYNEEIVNVIPYDIRRKYFLRGKGDNKKLYKVMPFLRSRINWGRFNLMSPQYSIPGAPFDIIFCRNVLIYFDRQRQAEIIDKLYNKLNYGGVLFLGHSESMVGLNSPLKSEGFSVYRKI